MTTNNFDNFKTKRQPTKDAYDLLQNFWDSTGNM